MSHVVRVGMAKSEAQMGQGHERRNVYVQCKVNGPGLEVQCRVGTKGVCLLQRVFMSELDGPVTIKCVWPA